jgi:hypothetical protein
MYKSESPLKFVPMPVSRHPLTPPHVLPVFRSPKCHGSPAAGARAARPRIEKLLRGGAEERLEGRDARRWLSFMQVRLRELQNLPRPHVSAGLAIPGKVPAQNIRQAARRIEPPAQQRPHGRIADPRFQASDHIFVDRVFPDHPCQADRRRDDMVHETLFRIVGRDVAEARLANWPDFKLFALGPGKSGRAQPAFPVDAVFAENGALILAVILSKDESRDGALQGVSDIVHQERIAVGPSVQAVERIDVAPDEGLVRGARAVLGGIPESVLDYQEFQGLQQEVSPVDSTGFFGRRIKRGRRRVGRVCGIARSQQRKKEEKNQDQTST